MPKSLGPKLSFHPWRFNASTPRYNHRLVLWTVRKGKHLDEAVEYCRKNGIEFYAVNKNFQEEEPGSSRKLNADIFVDDRNVGGFLGWGEVYQAIANKELDIPKKKKSSAGLVRLSANK